MTERMMGSLFSVDATFRFVRVVELAPDATYGADELAGQPAGKAKPPALPDGPSSLDV
jgi:hypothetical protein